MTDIGNDTNKWKDLSCSLIIEELHIIIMEELILLKLTTLPKGNLQIQSNPH